MVKTVKILGLIFGILCVTSAVLQYNDPDPVLWIVIYAFAALLSFAFALKKVSFKILFASAIALLIGSFYVMPEKFEGFTIGEGDIVNIEQAREAGGLLILAIVLFLFAFMSKKNKSKV